MSSFWLLKFSDLKNIIWSVLTDSSNSHISHSYKFVTVPVTVFNSLAVFTEKEVKMRKKLFLEICFKVYTEKMYVNEIAAFILLQQL